MKPKGDVCGWYRAWDDDIEGTTWDVDCVTDPVVLDSKQQPGSGTFNYCPNCGRRAIEKQIDYNEGTTVNFSEGQDESDTDKVINFRREPRYLVFKIKDLDKYLDSTEKDFLSNIEATIIKCRSDDDRNPLACVVVEDDWPEYKQVCDAISERVLGIKF